VVVPVYRQAAIIPALFEAYARQTLPLDEFELVMVDDGSGDDTVEAIEAHRSNNLRVTVEASPHGGPNRARNTGARLAQGEYLLITGGDILPDPGLLAAHLAAHEAGRGMRELAILGLVEWDPQMVVTPFMRFLTDTPSIFPQFQYYRLTSGEEADWTFFYTCNVSLRRDFLLEHEGFDERMDLPYADDSELSYRLARSGLVLRYHPEALAYHRHPTTLASVLKRARTAGLMLRRFETLHPDGPRFPRLMDPKRRALLERSPGLLRLPLRLVIAAVELLIWLTSPLWRRLLIAIDRRQGRFDRPAREFLYICLIRLFYHLGRHSR
jgi:GT2 family glycosyltransferase